jgi:hypothetical protein
MAKERKKTAAKAKGPGRPPGRKYLKLLQVHVTEETHAKMKRFQYRCEIPSFTEAHRLLIERGLDDGANP